MQTFTFEQAYSLAQSQDCTHVPLVRELLLDELSPVLAFRRLRAVSDHCFMLESAATEAGSPGRYTFLGFDPKLGIACHDHVMTFTSARGCEDEKVCDQKRSSGEGSLPQKHSFHVDHPRSEIRSILAQHRIPRIEGLPPFTGGLVGYFSYDYLKYAEPTLRLDAHDSEGFCDVDLMLFDKVVAFDHFHQTVFVIALACVSGMRAEAQVGFDAAREELDRMVDILQHGKRALLPGGRLQAELQPFFDKEAYCKMVEQAKYHIVEGDIFQVVLSNRLSAPYEGSLFNAYRVLRAINPSPYLFYFSSSDMEVAGASPETLVKLQDGVVHTFPLAGTRKRGATPEEDARFEAELLADEKELAEHNMLVDLGRNDLGRVSTYGSVTVEELRGIHRYSHVMHIGSVVRGEIALDKDALDCIDAVLPAGTLSGAPKLSACQIINDLEQDKRGIYGGAVGYLDLAGNMDVCIGIRLAYLKEGRVYIRSGAGIVSDSVPENEYQECMNKAQAMVEALHKAGDLA